MSFTGHWYSSREMPTEGSIWIGQMQIKNGERASGQT